MRWWRSCDSCRPLRGLCRRLGGSDPRADAPWLRRGARCAGWRLVRREVRCGGSAGTILLLRRPGDFPKGVGGSGRRVAEKTTGQAARRNGRLYEASHCLASKRVAHGDYPLRSCRASRSLQVNLRIFRGNNLLVVISNSPKNRIRKDFPACAVDKDEDSLFVGWAIDGLGVSFGLEDLQQAAIGFH